jgi:hypothetical protein
MSIQEATTSTPTLTRLMAVGVWALPVYARCWPSAPLRTSPTTRPTSPATPTT